MDVVAGHADEALDQEEVLGLAVGVQFGLGDGLDEDHNVAAPRLAVVHQRHPLGGRSQRDAVDDEVIADQQRLFHRSGRDDEVLREKGENEQAHHQHRADAGHGFKRRFFHPGGLRSRFLTLLGGFFGCSRLLLCHSVARCGSTSASSAPIEDRINAPRGRCAASAQIPRAFRRSSRSCPSLSSAACCAVGGSTCCTSVEEGRVSEK